MLAVRLRVVPFERTTSGSVRQPLLLARAGWVASRPAAQTTKVSSTRIGGAKPRYFMACFSPAVLVAVTCRKAGKSLAVSATRRSKGWIRGFAAPSCDGCAFVGLLYFSGGTTNGASMPRALTIADRY